MSPEPPRLLCLVEIPKGSRNKYEWDEELQAIRLDRFPFSSVVYPTDYGFVPDTTAEDGDPPQPLLDEISHFFSIYKQPEGKVVKVDGWHDRETALRIIEEARE